MRTIYAIRVLELLGCTMDKAFRWRAETPCVVSFGSVVPEDSGASGSSGTTDGGSVDGNGVGQGLGEAEGTVGDGAGIGVATGGPSVISGCEEDAGADVCSLVGAVVGSGWGKSDGPSGGPGRGSGESVDSGMPSADSDPPPGAVLSPEVSGGGETTGSGSGSRGDVRIAVGWLVGTGPVVS